MEKLDEIISICRLVQNGDEYLDDSIIRDILNLALEVKTDNIDLNKKLGKYAGKLYDISKANDNLAKKSKVLANQLFNA